jgi:hypothetical protein
MYRIRQQLNLESLKDRRLLATCNVVRLGDFGAGGTMGDFSRGDLRFCINKANDNPGPDVINIIPGGTINLTGPLPDLASDMEIVGPGSGLLTIRRDTGGDYRVITVAGGSANISGVTLANGRADVGGGIYNQGSLLLEDAVVTSSVSTLGFGGGVYNAGHMIADDSVISNNTAIASGSGAKVYGGGVFNAGSLTLESSTIADNVAESTAASCLFLDALGGGISTLGSLSVASSLVAGNQANAVGPMGLGCWVTGWGGGIHIGGSDATVVNSTIADNGAGGVGGTSADGVGGGIYVEAGALSVNHSTIASNVLWGVAGGFGGGLTIHPDAMVTVRHTIIADNNSPDLHGSLEASGFNVIESYWGSDFEPTDILGVDPLLGPLAANGGPTQTMALLPGSPAIDAGDPNPDDPPEWDQRGPGFPRIVNGRIDIGAFEVQATGAPPAPLLHVTLLNTADLEALT